jgi:hypothetical protein
MRDWVVILGGLVCWAMHFMLIYGFASMADVSSPAIRGTWSWLGAAGTVLAFLAVTWVAVEARSKRTGSELTRYLGLGGCILSSIAIALQSLPLLVAG